MLRMLEAKKEETKAIQVKIKNVYGNDLIYPACETANLFAEMLSKKTLAKRDLDYIKMLGYSVQLVNAYGL